ncbi:MAG: VTT domain-containing protein [Kiritimatiellia bacterium]
MDFLAFAGSELLNTLIEAIKSSSEYPWTQGWLTAIATFFFENVTCWTIVPPLISEGILSWMTSLQSTFWGVFIGDILMYLPVRFAMRYIIRLRWMQRHQSQIEACGHFFDRHLGKTMFIIRFTPGIRTFALIAAGMLRVHLGWYTFWSAVSCLIQSCIVTFFMPTLYAPAIARLKELWITRPGIVIAIIVAFFVAFAILQGFIAKAVMHHISQQKPADNA